MSRDNIHNIDTSGLGLVFNELLQLPPSPPVQSVLQLFVPSERFTNVGQLLENDRSATLCHRFGDNRRTNCVVNMAYVTRLTARDSSQQLSCRRRAVALKSPSKRQKAIPFISESATSKKDSAARGGQNILAQVDTHESLTRRSWNFGKIDRNVQVPFSISLYEVSFSNLRLLKKSSLKGAQSQYELASDQGEDRSALTYESIRPRVQMDCALRSEPNTDPWSTIGTMSLKTPSRSQDRLTGQLRAEPWKAIPQLVIHEMMQAYPVDATMLERHLGRSIAGLREQRAQMNKLCALFGVRMQTNCYRARHGRRIIRDGDCANGLAFSTKAGRRCVLDTTILMRQLQ